MISESDNILLQLSGGKNCHLLQQHTCCSKHFLSIPRHFDRDLFDIKRLASTTLARFHYKSCLPCSVTGCQNASRTNYPFKQARVSATPQQLSILSQAAFPLMVLLFRWSEPKSMVLTTLFCSWEFKILSPEPAIPLLNQFQCTRTAEIGSYLLNGNSSLPLTLLLNTDDMGVGFKKVQKITKLRSWPDGPTWKLRFSTNLQFRKCRNCRIYLLLFRDRSNRKKVKDLKKKKKSNWKQRG